MGYKSVTKKLTKKVEVEEITKFLVCDFCGAETEADEDGITPERDEWTRIICDSSSRGEWIDQDWRGTFTNWMHLCPSCWPGLREFIESKRKK